MSDPGYGSYIANAAEAERNRRSQGQNLLKKLDMQKYGIDTSASTQRYGIDTNKKIAEDNLAFQTKKFDEQVRQFNVQDARTQSLFDIGMQEDEFRTGLGDYITDASKKRTEETLKREALEKDDEQFWFPSLRSGDIEADEYKGISGKALKWWRSEGFFGPEKGEPGYDSPYDPKYDLNIGGEAITPVIPPLDLTQYRTTPESLEKYGKHIQTADLLQKGGSDKSYMNLWGFLK